MSQINHLTDQEIAQYAADSSGPGMKNQAFESHIAGCNRCQMRLSLESERRNLGILETGLGSSIPTPDCPQGDTLEMFAIGLCSPEESRKIFLHVADCSYCAPLLKAYRAALQDDEKEQGGAPVPARGLRKIFQSFGSIIRSFKSIGVFPKLAVTGATTLTLAFLWPGPLLFNLVQLHRAQSTWAAAFQEVRSNAMRLPGAPYAPVNVQRRGPGSVSISEYPKLAEAVSLAAKAKQSSDPRWLRYRGEVKLLLGEEDAATLLANAKNSGLDDPSTEIDLAAAYFQRDTQAKSNSGAAGTPPDLGGTIDLLSKVLKNPKLNQEQRVVALFDLAVAYGKMLRWNDAVDTWEQYLKLDQSGPWHEEAQHNLEEAKKKIPPPKQQGYREPEFFLAHLSEPEVQNSLEEYQEIALRTWLVDAAGHENSAASLAAHKLAELIEQRHGDPWMSDFLKAHRPGDLSGLQALGEAITSSRHGNYNDAQEKARKAITIFIHNDNSPGALRARVEAVYAHQRLLADRPCLEQAKVLDRELQRTRYSWLQIQIILETAVCFNMQNKIEPAKEQIEIAGRRAKSSGYRFLSLRVQGLGASMEALHDCGDTWQQASLGLEQYWLGPSSPQRLYELYSPVKQCFEKKKLWYAAEVLERRLITILEKEIDPEDDNPFLQSIAHSTLQRILKALDEDGEAEEQEKLALLHLDRVEKSSVLKFKIPAQLQLADLQLDRGDTDAALGTVREVEKSLDSSIPLVLYQTFYRVRGDVWLAKQQLQEAENDYKRGVEVAEKRQITLQAEEKRRQWARETGDLYRGLVSVLLQEGREQEAVQLFEFYRYRPFAAPSRMAPSSSGPKWADIEQAVLRQPLPQFSNTRLVYVSTRNQLYILTIGSDGIKATAHNENRDDLQRRIQQYIEKCSAPQDPRVPLPPPNAESTDLFSRLLQPVMAHLRETETVVVEPDDALTGLPLESLKSPDGPYFGEKFPIIYSPGYLRENDLRTASQQRPRWGLVIDALDSTSERDDLADLFPELRVINGMDLSASQLPELLQGGEMMVYIGHANSAALILNKKTLLTAANFPPVSLKRLQLAVLAACSTGAAKDGIFDTSNLVHAFQSGGTPGVVASQWDVGSSSTTELMKRFYSHLQKNESVARALYAARKEVIPLHRHPYYWAGFILNGRA